MSGKKEVTFKDHQLIDEETPEQADCMPQVENVGSPTTMVVASFPSV